MGVAYDSMGNLYIMEYDASGDGYLYMVMGNGTVKVHYPAAGCHCVWPAF
jgi:hypothetical protein